MARINPTKKQSDNLYEANAYSCCVCKRTNIGLHLHHIDGNNSNTVEDNLAVLCVSDHDVHHRPQRYPNHLELDAETIKQYKCEWEQFVLEAKKDNPKILATINVFGTEENVVGFKLIFQNTSMNIIFERQYQLLDRPIDESIDIAINEVLRLGKNIKVVLVNEPLGIEYCEKDSNSLANILDENISIMLTSEDWIDKVIAALYLNPRQASLALTIFYDDELMHTFSMHGCHGKLHCLTEKQDYLIDIIPNLPISVLVEQIIDNELEVWQVPSNRLLMGTGEENNPNIIKNFSLPEVWLKEFD